MLSYVICYFQTKEAPSQRVKILFPKFIWISIPSVSFNLRFAITDFAFENKVLNIILYEYKFDIILQQMVHSASLQHFS